MTQPTIPANRLPDGTFPPGVSGNASGRPKSSRAVTLMCRKLTPKAIKALEEALEAERQVATKDEVFSFPDHKTRIDAAEKLLARGHGKAATVDVMAKMDAAIKQEAGGDDFPVKASELTDSQLARILTIARENLP